MKLGLMNYLRAAFNARPIGMWIPPNWIGLGAFGLLGALNPGFWVLGLGLELGYLYAVATNQRFQRLVDAKWAVENQKEWQTRLQDLVSKLGFDDQHRYHLLERRCRLILDQQYSGNPGPELKIQAEGLGRLLWIYLRLLLTRQSLNKVLQESAGADGDRKPIDERIQKLEEKLQDPSLSEDLRKSYTGQIDILRQRQEKQKEAKEKLVFIEAELTRIQEQAELIREQAVLTADPEIISQRIDQISGTLGGTTQWIREQQQIYGSVEDLLTEPPPIAVSSPAVNKAAKESQ